LTHIGDAVLSTCVIEPLRRAFPGATMELLTGERAAPLFENEPEMARLIVVPHSKQRSLSERWRLIRSLRRRRFDVVVDLRDAPYSWLLGAKRIGLRDYSRRHAVDRYLDALSRAGIPTEGARPRLTLSEAERQRANDWLRTNGVSFDKPLVGVHPGGNWAYKLWEAERFAAVADALAESHGAQTLVFAGPGESPLRERVVSAMSARAFPVGDVTLRMLAALIAACDLYIGNDTGPMHIAAAVNTRVVALFEPTDDLRSGPYGSEHTVVRSGLRWGCNPCHPGKRPGGCGRGFCEPLLRIEAPTVIEVARRQLDAAWEEKRAFVVQERP